MDYLQQAVYVPYWFLILVFGLVLLFAWRKTGHKKPDGAFPVVMHTK